MKNSNDKPTVAKISDPQRLCLSHILRNCEQAIEGLLTIVEDPYSVFSPDDVADSLQNACKELDRVLKAAKRGSFCAIPESECKFVSYFVGCNGQPIKGEEPKPTALKVLR
jgi:hypothetical protein